MSYEALLRELRTRPAKGCTFLIGVDGLGGSGKSTLARGLAVAAQCTVIQLDDFYKPSHARSPAPPEAHAPGADFDLARFEAQVLAPLARGEAARYERYDWENDRLGELVFVAPGGLVIVEGVYSTSRTLAGYYDYRVWVECPRQIRLARGLERDGESARERCVKDWMPREDVYVEREHPELRADRVVRGDERERA